MERYSFLETACRCRCGTWPTKGLGDEGKVCKAALVPPVIYFWTGLSSAHVQSFPDWSWSWSIPGKTDGPAPLFSLYSSSTLRPLSRTVIYTVASSMAGGKWGKGSRVKACIDSEHTQATFQASHLLVATSCSLVNVLSLRAEKKKNQTVLSDRMAISMYPLTVYSYTVPY